HRRRARLRLAESPDADRSEYPEHRPGRVLPGGCRRRTGVDGPRAGSDADGIPEAGAAGARGRPALAAADREGGMSIRIHIERLVRDGVPLATGDGPGGRAAVQTELARLVAEGGLAADVLAGGALEARAGGPMQLREGSAPGELGKGIAHAVYGGIGP